MQEKSSKTTYLKFVKYYNKEIISLQICNNIRHYVYLKKENKIKKQPVDNVDNSVNNFKQYFYTPSKFQKK